MFVANLFGAKNLLVQHYFWVSPLFYTLQVEECHTINKRRGFEFLSWFLCGNHKSGNLCCMNCAFPLVFVGLHMLPISMLVGLSYAFKGWEGLPKSTCSQVDLLIVYVYCLVWNFRWKAMCLPTHAIITTMKPRSCGWCGQWPSMGQGHHLTPITK